jgi:hypothetical protein
LIWKLKISSNFNSFRLKRRTWIQILLSLKKIFNLKNLKRIKLNVLSKSISRLMKKKIFKEVKNLFHSTNIWKDRNSTIWQRNRFSGYMLKKNKNIRDNNFLEVKYWKMIWKAKALNVLCITIYIKIKTIQIILIEILEQIKKEKSFLIKLIKLILMKKIFLKKKKMKKFLKNKNKAS